MAKIRLLPDAKILMSLRPTKGNVAVLLFIVDKSNISSILERIKPKISFIELDIDTGFIENGPGYIRGTVESVDVNGQKVARRKQQEWWKGPGIYYMNNLSKTLDYDDRQFNDFHRSLYSLADSEGAGISNFPVNETKLFGFFDNEQCELLLKRFKELKLNNRLQIIHNIS